jgi:D-alanyl-D-alanine dipeptidase
MHMRVVDSLSEYALLTKEQRLSSYLVEDVAATVPLGAVEEPLVDVRSIDRGVLLFDPSLPDPRLRRTAAERLVAVGRDLSERGFLLEVVECLRSYEKQKREFQDISASMHVQHVHLSGKDLWRKVTEFIADPDMCPPHVTGGAVDVRLRRIDGSFVDMGTEVNALHSAATLLSPYISSEARMNRRMLLDAFLGQGFAPMPSEWWHFSFGDRYWGAFYDRPAMYDVIRSQ